MEIAGLPLHPLVVHAAVVLGPLASLVGLAYAARPSWRWALRWPLVVLAVAAFAGVVLAWFSGRAYLDELAVPPEAVPLYDRLQAHQDRAGVLLGLSASFVVDAALAAWALRGPSALASGRGGGEDRRPWSWVALVLLVAGSVAVVAVTVWTGHVGAQAVHGGV